MQHHTRKKRSSLRRRAKAVAIILYTAERKAVGALLLCTIALALLYVYFLGSAVVHAVARKEVQQDIAQASSRIAELEVEYLQRKDRITRELASEMGFRSIAQKDYIERARYLGRADSQR
jgi:hypothetical protein